MAKYHDELVNPSLSGAPQVDARNGDGGQVSEPMALSLSPEPRSFAGWRLSELPYVLTRLPTVISGWVLPPVCLECSRRTAWSGALCGDCWRRVSWIERPFCERLGTPFDHEQGPGALSPAALANPPPYNRARFAARYAGPARKLVHRLKFNDRLDLAPALSMWMVRAGSDLLKEADLLVPVPLHRTRLWHRRFNQAALLCKHVGRRANVAVDVDCLRRTRHTRQQVGLSGQQRRRNVQGAFALRPGSAPAVVGRRILLIDDVITTGATVRAVAAVLLRAGARDVDVLAFAAVIGGEEESPYISANSGS